MTYLLVLRFLVDYFWSMKVLSIFHSLIGGWMLLRRLKLGLVAGFTKVDLAIIAFTLLLIFSIIRTPSGNLIDFVKLISISLFYFLGRFSQNDILNINLLSKFSIISLLILFFVSSFNFGYVYWGSYKTFTGGYFFKTDLALAVIVFYGFALSYRFRSYWPPLILTLISAWLIWQSNARIALLALALITAITGYLSLNKTSKFSLFVWLLLILVGSYTVLSFLTESSEHLKLNFADFWSESNLQGRNWIWIAVLRYYSEMSVLSKFLGDGFSADRIATGTYSVAFSTLGDSRAHNSYLYLLVCVGWSGLLSFLIINILWIKELIFSVRFHQGPAQIICLTLLIAFQVFSLTTDALIRAQIMVPLAFFMGRIVLINRVKASNE